MNTSGMGYKILDERYALLECLAVSGLGEIYRGRDLELAQTENSPSRILIHLLPNQPNLGDLGTSLEQAQQLTKKLNKPWILPILAQGKLGDRPYFVLQGPDSLGAHSLMSLPSQQLPQLNKLTQQFGSLVKAKQLPEMLDSALIITLPNQSLYLLATAFIQPLHALRAAHTGLTLSKRPTLKPALALSGIMAIAVSTFAVEYRDHTPRHLSAQVVSTPLASPQILLEQAEAATHDRPVPTEILALPLALQEPPPQLEPALVQLGSAKPATTAKPVDKITTTTEVKSVGNLKPNETPKLTEKTLISKPTSKSVEEQPKSIKNKEVNSIILLPSQPSTQVVPSIEAIETKLPTLTSPPSQIIDSKPVAALSKKIITPAPELSLEELIERANKALELRNFSTKNGVLFYVRQIKIRDHLHSQVERLGRFTVMHYHELTRNFLKLNEPTQAQQLLINSKSLIQEFNLKSLNSAQQVLEHKSNQYN